MSYNFKINRVNINGKDAIIFAGGDVKEFAEFCKDITKRFICSAGYITFKVQGMPTTVGEVLPMLMYWIDSGSVLMKPEGKDTFIPVSNYSEFSETERLTEEQELFLNIKIN